jgi:hypothetical protein
MKVDLAMAELALGDALGANASLQVILPLNQLTWYYNLI